jgi:ATP-dependent Clp protease, protease subunit
VTPTLGLYSLIRALPAKINTHAQGFVASAATILFLAGQDRSADRNARFLFHPSQSTVFGQVSEAQIQDQLTQFIDLEDEITQIYHDQTKLSDDDIKQFQRETVIFDAEKAQKSGIIQTIADLRIEGDQKAKIPFIE